MGNESSKSGSQADAEKKEAERHFSSAEIRTLKKRFKKLDLNGDKALSKDELLQIEGLQQNPLVERVIAIMDVDKNEEVDWVEFLRALYLFTKDDVEEKLKFVFKLYDVDNDDYISNKDLYTILKIMVGDNLDKVSLQQLVDRTIHQADKDKDGKLSMEEFKDFCQDFDFLSMRVDLVSFFVPMSPALVGIVNRPEVLPLLTV